MQVETDANTVSTDGEEIPAVQTEIVKEIQEVEVEYKKHYAEMAGNPRR